MPHNWWVGFLILFFFNQLQGVEYELLAICGVNAQVSEPGKFGYFDNCDGYPYSHVNILARQKGSWLSDAPTLLFIQCSNDSENKEDIPLCLPVSKSSKDAGLLHTLPYLFIMFLLLFKIHVVLELCTRIKKVDK